MRIARFCRRMMCDPALESFLRELSEWNEIFEKKTDFLLSGAYCCSTNPSEKFSVFKMSKSTTAKNISAFADLVKVSRNKISFDL